MWKEVILRPFPTSVSIKTVVKWMSLIFMKINMEGKTNYKSFSFHQAEIKISKMQFRNALLHLSDWLKNKLINHKYHGNEIQSWRVHTHFPSLRVSYMYFLQVLIGSLDCLCPLWLARMITLVVFVLPHSVQNHSSNKFSCRKQLKSKITPGRDT